jgi:pimeloyl-ACP methyl ester carboxylesterase
MVRLISRIGLALLLGLLVAAPVCWVGFTSWREALERELTRDSTVVMTARGPVEYAEIGSGRPVLAIHGTPGGYDQTLNYLKAAGTAPNVRYIMPSRPGYLRTPLSVGRTPKEQADALAALLDALGIKRVAVIGTSGGGPAALQFALNYPDRCSALVLEEAVTARMPALPFSNATFVYDDWFTWLDRFAATLAWQAKAPHDPQIPAITRAMMDSLAPRAEREAGRVNDELQFARIVDWPLNQIRCPTLILHGGADRNVPLDDSQRAHAQIAGSELLVMPGEDHFMVVTRHAALDGLIGAFLAKHQ